MHVDLAPLRFFVLSCCSITEDDSFNLRIIRIIAENWENNSNRIKELENRIIAKIWSIIILSLAGGGLRMS